LYSAQAQACSKLAGFLLWRSTRIMTYRTILTDYFAAAIAAASPRLVLPSALPKDLVKGKTFALAYGKAAAEMALVAAETLAGPVTGLAVTRHGHGVDLSHTGIELIEARHPVPDEYSLLAGNQMLELAATAGPDDRVVFLASGGGSALLCAPANGISLAEKQAMTDALVRSGAPIQDINLVRRHVSRVKGGRLGAVAGARGAELLTFVISDVAGDDPALVASGPSIASTFNPDGALSVLLKAGVDVPDHIVSAIRYNRPTAVADHLVKVIATNGDALAAVESRARADGWNVIDAGKALTGDAATCGKAHALRAQMYARTPGRHLMISGGELTVTNARQYGQGGPNLEYLVGLMSALPQKAKIEALAGDTDGIDGTQDNAGGYLHASWVNQSEALHALNANRTYPFVQRLGGLILTGPTRTNVNDIRLIAIEGVSI
jgi:glycerate 2-kinase